MLRESAGVDAHYTPWSVALQIADVLPEEITGTVFDPTVGGGALLAAVRDRFYDRVTLAGIDIDRNVVRTLRTREPSWLLSSADFLSASSRGASKAWRAAVRDLSVVVMNPPFSYRGNGGVALGFDDFSGRVSPAMHFLAVALKALRPTHGFYAVLPDGALDAERHAGLWNAIGRTHDVSRIVRLRATSFAGVRVSTSIVRILRRQEPVKVSAGSYRSVLEFGVSPVERSGCSCLEVVRGRVPVHKMRNGERVDQVPFAHTTDLASHGFEYMADLRLSDEAPFVLIPRVGSWRPPRVVDMGRVVLSDCLFGLRPRPSGDVHEVARAIHDASAYVRSLYVGTGAPYLTIGRLKTGLEQMGWHVHVVRAGTEVGACCCSSAAAASPRDGCGNGLGMQAALLG